MSSETALARRNAKLIKATVRIISARTPPPNLSHTNKIIHDVVRERSNPGKKMVKIGTALILLPEPVTGVAGVPILALGKALSSRQSGNLKEVYEELRNSMKVISAASSLR